MQGLSQEKTVRALSVDELRLLRAAGAVGRDAAERYRKCAVVLRLVLAETGDCDDEAEVAICNSGYEDLRVGRLYDCIRALVDSGLLEGRGDLSLPAGPRYTECRLSPAGEAQLNPSGDCAI